MKFKIGEAVSPKQEFVKFDNSFSVNSRYEVIGRVNDKEIIVIDDVGAKRGMYESFFEAYTHNDITKELDNIKEMLSKFESDLGEIRQTLGELK